MRQGGKRHQRQHPIATARHRDKATFVAALWERVPVELEREQLFRELAAVLTDLSADQAVAVRARFTDCVDRGGAQAVRAICDRSHHLALPLIHPAIVNRFVEAEVGPTRPNPRELARSARRYRKAAKKMREAKEALSSVSRLIEVINQVAEVCTHYAATFERRSIEALRESPGPGRLLKRSTRLALDLEETFELGERLDLPRIPTAERCRLIAAVVSAFIEPVDAETLRQRLKDLRRREARTPGSRR